MSKEEGRTHMTLLPCVSFNLGRVGQVGDVRVAVLAYLDTMSLLL